MSPAAHRAAGRAAAAVSCSLVLLGAGACGDDGGGAPTGPASTTSSVGRAEETATTTTAPAEEEATLGDEVDDELAATEEGHTALVEVALGLLIAAGELEGQTFADAGYLPTEGPNGCGIDVDADHQPSVLVGTALVDGEGRSIVEELRVYADVDAAVAAFEAHRSALGCGNDGAGTAFGEPVDVNDVVGADASTEVAVVSEDETAVLITALVGDAVLTFHLAAPAATPAGLDPREVAAFGVGKVLAALEAG